MFLYTQYGMIQGTVDEILEFIQKQTPVSIQSNGTNEIKVDVKPFNQETNDVNKMFVDMGATSNETKIMEDLIKENK